MIHFLVADGLPGRMVTFECEHRRFLCQGGSLRGPPGARQTLRGTQGWTLEPVMSLQLSIELQPYERRELCFATIAAVTREAAIEAAEHHASLASHEAAIGNAVGKTARALDAAGIEPGARPARGMVASLLTYPTGRMGFEAAWRRENRLGQSHLWALAISGDLPILLVKSGTSHPALLKTLIPA